MNDVHRTEDLEVGTWRKPGESTPLRNKPVLCAWGRNGTWQYGIAKFTGKRWLDVIPETANEQYFTPAYWQYIKDPP